MYPVRIRLFWFLLFYRLGQNIGELGTRRVGENREVMKGRVVGGVFDIYGKNCDFEYEMYLFFVRIVEF